MKARYADAADIAGANQAFRVQVKRVGFHFRCGSCTHVHRGSAACSLGYPNGYLRGEVVAIQPDGNLAFCKYFELGETLESID